MGIRETKYDNLFISEDEWRQKYLKRQKETQYSSQSPIYSIFNKYLSNFGRAFHWARHCGHNSDDSTQTFFRSLGMNGRHKAIKRPCCPAMWIASVLENIWKGGFIQGWAVGKFLEDTMPDLGRKALASMGSKMSAIFFSDENLLWVCWNLMNIGREEIEVWRVLSTSQHALVKLTYTLYFWVMLKIPLGPCLFIFCISVSLDTLWLILPQPLRYPFFVLY